MLDEPDDPYGAWRKGRIATKVRDASRSATVKMIRTSKAVRHRSREGLRQAKRSYVHHYGQEARSELTPVEYYVKLAKLIGPIGLTIALLAVLWFVQPFDSSRVVAAYSTIYLLPMPVGKESYIPLAISQHAHPLAIALGITYMDLMLSSVVAWNFDHLRDLPWLGWSIAKYEEGAQAVMRRSPWMRRSAFAGISLLVMVPFQGSGGAVAGIIGRMIGMRSERIIAATGLGAFVGCLLIAYAWEQVLDCIGIRVLYTIVIGIIVVLVGLFLYKLVGPMLESHSQSTGNSPKVPRTVAGLLIASALLVSTWSIWSFVDPESSDLQIGDVRVSLGNGTANISVEVVNGGQKTAENVHVEVRLIGLLANPPPNASREVMLGSGSSDLGAVKPAGMRLAKIVVRGFESPLVPTYDGVCATVLVWEGSGFAAGDEVRLGPEALIGA